MAGRHLLRAAACIVRFATSLPAALLLPQITRIHWEKNRFIFDLMYNRKVRFCLSLMQGSACTAARVCCRQARRLAGAAPWPPGASRNFQTSALLADAWCQPRLLPQPLGECARPCRSCRGSCTTGWCVRKLPTAR